MSPWPYLFFLGIGTLQAAAETLPTINLRYSERPPFVIEQKGALYGDTASPAIDAFIQAHIPFTLVNTPTSRQLLIISNNQGYDCGFGWFKNPEREKFARFSDMIYQDSPWILLTRKKNSIPEKNLKALFARKDLKLLTRENFSYGPYLDALIQKANPTKYLIAGSGTQMLQMIHAGRADYMFISEREVDYLLSSLSLPKTDFLILSFPEIPKGEKRYIMCSQKVPPLVIEKLNQSLKKIRTSGAKRQK